MFDSNLEETITPIEKYQAKYRPPALKGASAGNNLASLYLAFPVAEDQDFAAQARIASERAGCRFLFELPGLPQLQDPETPAQKVAAILCPADEGTQITFLVLDEESRELHLLDAAQMPDIIVNITHSFASVVSQLFVPGAEHVQGAAH